jgi:hypothetical protein
MVLLISVALLGLLGLPVQAPAEALKAGVSVSQYLPPEMYGHWSVRETLVSTDSPDTCKPFINDVWILDQVGETVVLTNPVTRASATLHVDQVQGNRAQFHRDIRSSRERVVESPDITVTADKLFGQTQIYWERYNRQGKVVETRRYTYRFEADRVGNARVQFGPTVPAQALEFEIAPVEKRN